MSKRSRHKIGPAPSDAEVILHDDWDVTIRPINAAPTFVGRFAGRRHLIEHLADELKRKTHGSILVYGHRGAGKSSAVYAALKRYLEATDGAKPLVVMLGAPQLVVDSQTRNTESNDLVITPDSLIRQLIRGLYRVAETKVSGNIAAELSVLHKIASAADAKVIDRQTGVHKTAKLTTYSTKTSFNGSLQWLIYAASLLIAGAVEFAGPRGTAFAEFLRKIAVIALATPFPSKLLISMTLEKNSSSGDETVSESGQTFVYDDSLGNLVAKLDSLHQLLAEQKKPQHPVYVVDELDKIRIDGVHKALEYYKTLFTTSSATFVFVGNENTIEQLMKASAESGDKGSIRTSAYTLFSSVYYVPRPSPSEIDEFVDSVVVNSDGLSSGANATRWSDCKNCLVFRAQGDLFDLFGEIRNVISGFDSRGALISLEGFGESQRIEAQLQRSIRACYEAYHSNELKQQRTNELILRGLYGQARDILIEGAEIAVPIGNETETRARRDFLYFLRQLGVLAPISADGRQSGDLAGYKFDGEFLATVPPALGFRTETQRSLINAYRTFQERTMQLLNVHRVLHEIELLDASSFEKKYDAHMSYIEAWSRDFKRGLHEVRTLFRDLVFPDRPVTISDEKVQQMYDITIKAIQALDKSRPMIIGNIFLASGRLAKSDFELQVDHEGIDVYKTPQMGGLVAAAESLPVASLKSLKNNNRLLIYGDPIRGQSNPSGMNQALQFMRNNNIRALVCAPVLEANYQLPGADAIALNSVTEHSLRGKLIPLIDWLDS